MGKLLCMKTKLLIVLSLFALQYSFAKALTVVDPVAPNLPDLNYCDSNNDGFGAFDLTEQNAAILSAQSGAASNYSITYHETSLDADTGINPLASPYYNISPDYQVIHFRVRNMTTNDYAIGYFYLAVNTRPVANFPGELSVCDTNNDGIALFNLTTVVPAILGGVTPPGINVSFYTSQASANAGVGTIIPINSYVGTNGETIWARVESIDTGCYAVVSFNLVVNNAPFATGPQNYSSCDNYFDPNDGVAMIDLTTFALSILNGQNPAVFLLSYYTSLADAQAGTNPLTPAQAAGYVTDADIDTIWVKVENSSGSITPFCYAVTTIDITVERNPTPIITTIDNVSSNICVDFITNQVVRPLTLNSNIFNPSAYTFIWYENGGIIAGANNSTYIVNSAATGGASRTYAVVVTSITPEACLTTSAAFAVEQSGQAVPWPGTNGYTITNLSGVQSITVNIIGYSYGEYEYSLDSGPRQTSNVFENVSLGSHTINVWDTEGGLFYSCDPLVISDVEIATSEIPAPTGLISQTFPAGSTLADIVVNGTDVQWYDSASNKNQLSTFSTPLPLNTVLVDGTTYYATQTIGGIESTAYLPVTVHLTLGTDDNEILPIQFAPNPIKNNLTLQSTSVLKSITVYTILGQKVFEQNYNDTNVSIDLSRLTTGNYVLKAQGETGQKTIRIVKE